MKFGNLKSLGHNVADSLASGIGFVIGMYEMDIFGEASASSEGFISVDFLNGSTTGAVPSSNLSRAIFLYKEALPAMCEKHHIDLPEIKTIIARFGTDPAYGPHFKVTVEDTHGKSATDQYVGIPGRKLRHRTH